METRLHRAGWAAATCAGVLLVFAPVLAGQRTLAQRDTDLLYAPVRTLVVAELRAGRLPLWNPHEGTGKPLLAEGIHGVLHPISLACAALAPGSVDALLLCYLAAAALGALALARTLGASGPAASAAGLAFALAGFPVSMTGNLVFLAGLATLPWQLAAARAAGAGARWGAVAVALATACAFLSGDAQVAIVGAAAGMVLAADAGGLRGAGRTVLAMVAGVLLAGVQIAPTAALLPLTTRGVALPDAERARWALAPARLVEWVVPGLLRGPLAEVPRDDTGAPLSPRFAESVYLGAPLLVAAAFALRSRSRTSLLLGAGAALLLWLALGDLLGARQLLDGIPVWSRFRYPEKLMAPLTLCLCALGALGLEGLGAERLPRPWGRVLTGCAVAAGATLVALHAAPAATRALSLGLLGDAGPFYRATLAAGLPHLAVSLAAIVAVDRLAPGRGRALALGVVVALAPAAAVGYGAHLGDPDVRRPTTPLRLGEPAPAPRIVHAGEVILPAGDGRGAVDGFARVDALLLGDAIPVAHRVDTLEPYGAFEPLRVARLVRSFGGEYAVALRRFGLTHVVVQLPPADGAAAAVRGGELVQRDEAAGLELWAVPHRPWAFFAERASAAPSPDAARGEVLDLVARGDDRTVVVEAPASPPTAPGRVIGIARDTRTVEIEAESDGPALLVVQDAYWPGWRASVDGAPVEILAADALVRAVRWPPGRHRLAMTYDPPELRTGLALSAAGAGLALLLAALALRRRRPGPVR